MVMNDPSGATMPTAVIERVRSFVRSPLGDLRLAGLVEGTTLILLMGIAVPLKRMAGLPEATAVMGAVHGVAFLVYLAMLTDGLATGLIGRRVALRGLALALVPTGTFWNDPALRRAERRFRIEGDVACTRR